MAVLQNKCTLVSLEKNYTEANLKLQNTNKEKYDLATIYMFLVKCIRDLL